MIRKLLATTALASVIATGALAQDNSTQTPAAQPESSTQTGTMGAGAAAPADTAATTADTAATTADAGAVQAGYIQTLSGEQRLASDLTGKNVYASQAEDAESVGEIDNFLIGADGKVASVIIDANIGDQSRVIALPYDKISWMADEDGDDVRAVLTASQDELASAPTFTEPQQQAAADGAAGTTPATNPAGTAAAPVDKNAATTTTTTAEATSPATPAAPAAGTETAAADAGQAMSVGADQYLSETIIGENIYTGPADDADSIGQVNDLILASSGQVDAIVIGVGGFLGIGEKDVAVPFANVQMGKDADGDAHAVLAATKEQLEQAPAFDDDRDEAVAANDGTTTDTTAADSATTTTADNAASSPTLGASSDTAATTADNTAAPAAGTMADSGTAATAPAAGSTDMAANQNGMATTGVAGTASETTASTGGNDRANMTPVEDTAQLSADNLMGTTVYGPNDESIGEIGDIALNKDSKVDAVIIDVGGFLGIGAKPVAVAMDNLQFMRDSGGSLYLYTKFTRDQLNSAPEYNKDNFAQNRDTMMLRSDAGETPPAATGATPAQ
ncbi:PRC-barrel domain-containing protein [Mangrovicella endophytica]|uniref:PRC-barrel domain-containing protein n=1 Tax=Mangrovicella endophytica TaxID=2066697 RepID=UPI000C9E5BC5|nr:PRC-barrel domain-containing protein [Mangrovicella endophytica]